MDERIKAKRSGLPFKSPFKLLIQIKKQSCPKKESLKMPVFTSFLEERSQDKTILCFLT